MFDIKATRAWWNFFHRFSLVYQGANFDYILLLGLNLLQCHQCQDDAIKFYQTIGAHKNPFEKIHILHNYVNRKLKKQIFDLKDTKNLCSDVIIDQQPNWEKLIEYYFDLLFLMTDYLKPENLTDLKEFSAYIYQSIKLSKNIGSLAITVIQNGKFNKETLQMQVYEYYIKFKAAIQQQQHDRSKVSHIKSYPDIFGQLPKKTKICQSCAKKHQLYLEKHNQPKNGILLNQPSINKQLITPIKKPVQAEYNKSSARSPPVVKPPVQPTISPPVVNNTPVVIKSVVRRQLNNQKKTVLNSQIVRKKVIPIKPKPQPKQKRKIIFQKSRIIRYPQNRVESKNPPKL